MRLRVLPLALLFSSAAAPVIFSQTDCQKWVAEYLARTGHPRIAHSLRHVKHRLMRRKRPAASPAVEYHRMSREEALRRYLIDCGEMPIPDANATYAPIIPSTPLAELPPTELEWPDYGPPVFAFSPPTEVAEGYGPSEGYPGGIYPVLPVGPGGGGVAGGSFPGAPFPPVPPPVGPPATTPMAPTPEPATWMMVGCGALAVAVRRRAVRA